MEIFEITAKIAVLELGIFFVGALIGSDEYKKRCYPHAEDFWGPVIGWQILANIFLAAFVVFIPWRGILEVEHVQLWPVIRSEAEFIDGWLAFAVGVCVFYGLLFGTGRKNAKLLRDGLIGAAIGAVIGVVARCVANFTVAWWVIESPIFVISLAGLFILAVLGYTSATLSGTGPSEDTYAKQLAVPLGISTASLIMAVVVRLFVWGLTVIPQLWPA